MTSDIANMTNDEIRDMFPSLKTTHPAPHGWIQWKGTDVCMDIHCVCGELTHIDGSFCYHVKCCKCGKVYECDGHIQLIPMGFEPEGTKDTSDE